MKPKTLIAAGVLGAACAVALAENGAMDVETATVESRRLEKSISIPGDLGAWQAVDLHAKVSGFVDDVAVDRGSWVKHGAVLATVTAPELAAQRVEAQAKLEAAKAQRAEAEAERVAAQSSLERLAAAAATPGAVAGHDLEMAEQSLAAARAHVDAVAASVAAAEALAKSVSALESYLVLRAPFDGVVSVRNVHPGSLVGPGTGPLVRVEQVDRLRLTVPVPEIYVPGVAAGETVAFTVSAYPDRAFSGVVARLAHSLDVKTRTMSVELDVENAERALAPGMFAEVAWPVSRARPSLFVPASAVVRTSERQFVVRLADGAAEWVDVRRGESTPAGLEVFGELRPGDLVVRRGSDEIRPGTRLTAAPAAARTSP